MRLASRSAWLCGMLSAGIACCAAGAAAAATNGPVTLDFTPFGVAHVENASSGLAPADASFGRYPMSVMGIETTIRHHVGTRQLDEGPIAYAVVALRDWEKHYPRDPWIARDLFELQRVYAHARTEEGFEYAKHVARWLQTDYPDTRYAALSDHELACAARGGCWGFFW
jgi:hypothetical protein